MILKYLKSKMLQKDLKNIVLIGHARFQIHSNMKTVLQ